MHSTLGHPYAIQRLVKLIGAEFFVLFLQVTKSVGGVESDLKSNKTEQSIKNINKSEAAISKDKSKAEVKQYIYFGVIFTSANFAYFLYSGNCILLQLLH